MAAGVKSAAMKRLLLAATLVLSATAAQGWSKQGHQLVGELAERELTPAARAEVRRLLAGEADPTLAGIATWADEIRAASRTPDGNALGEMSSRWHYVNFRDEGCHYDAARECPDGNCVTGAIQSQARVLADRTRSDEERRNALKFVVHFVGDAHQPMHAGFAHDRGGNDFQVQYRGPGAPAGGQGTNLHGVWDYWLLQSAALDNPGYVSKLLAIQPPPRADGQPLDWTLESCRIIADDGLYPTTRRRILGDAYVERHRPTAETRVRQAGLRLAGLINQALDPAR